MQITTSILTLVLLATGRMVGAPALDPHLKTNAVVHSSAAGWSLRVAPDESTIVVSPKGREFKIGKTQYPDWLPATLWRVRVPALRRDFLVLHVSPMASGAVPMTLLTIKGDDESVVRAADIRHHYEWRSDITTTNQVIDALFVDSDSDGIPELVDDDVWKWGGKRTFYVLAGDRFVPRWEESTGKIVRTSRVLIQ